MLDGFSDKLWLSQDGPGVVSSCQVAEDPVAEVLMCVAAEDVSDGLASLSTIAAKANDT
jgi:hypothetical protein